MISFFLRARMEHVTIALPYESQFFYPRTKIPKPIIPTMATVLGSDTTSYAVCFSSLQGSVRIRKDSLYVQKQFNRLTCHEVVDEA